MVSADFHKRRNVVKKILISALVVASLTFTGAASAKKLKFQMSSKAGAVSYTQSPSPRDRTRSRMPSSA